MEEKKLGLRNVISVSVGLVIATSCLVSLGEGAGTIGITFIAAMVIACIMNMITMASVSELNALMPDTTGGLAQYTLASVGPVPTIVTMVGGYLISNVLSCGVEASIFAFAMKETIPLPLDAVSYRISYCKPKRRGYVCKASGCGSISAAGFHGCYGADWNVWPWNWSEG